MPNKQCLLHCLLEDVRIKTKKGGRTFKKFKPFFFFLNDVKIAQSL